MSRARPALFLGRVEEPERGCFEDSYVVHGLSWFGQAPEGPGEDPRLRS